MRRVFARSFRSTSLQAGASLLLLACVSTGRSQSGSETLSYFGALGQGNGGVTYVNPNYANSVAVGPNACVPTATANGLAFLENYANFGLDIPSPFTTTPNAYPQVNNLAAAMGTFNTTKSGAGGWTNLGGTYTTSMFNGLQNYLGTGGSNPAPTVSISGQYAGGTPATWFTGTFNKGLNLANSTPSPAFLAGALNANEAVEITLEWGSYNGNTWNALGGGHEVTLNSINMASGSGTIGFIDPWGSGVGSNPGTDGVNVNGTVSLVNGYLYVTYPITVSGPDPTDNNPGDVVGSNGETGRIDVAMVEAIPEPSTWLLGSAVLFLLIARRPDRRSRAT